MIFSETIKLKDEVSDPASKAAAEVKFLSSALDAAGNALLKAQATGNMSAFRKAQQDVASLNATLSTLPQPINQAKAAMDQLKTVDGKIKFSVEGQKAAQDAAKSLKSSLEQAKQEMAKAAAMGDHEAFGKAMKSAEAYGSALKKLPTPKTNGIDEFKASWANAAHAMEIGKETISAAFDGIGKAASALAQGDVKGAVLGLTDTVAGLSKMLDLVVPGLGQAVSAVIKIAGGLVGITAGLLQSGAEMAIEATTAKTAMLSMFDALGEGAISGAQVDDMLDGLSSKLGQTKDSMAPLVKEFMSMGVTSQEALEKMTTAALSAKALTGGSQSAADAFTKLSKKIQLAADTGQQLKIPLKGLGSLADMGLTVDDVAKKMNMSAAALSGQLKDGSVNAAKFGDAMNDALIEKGAGPLEKMGMSIANIGAMGKQFIGDMFEDLKEPVYGFLTEVKSLFSIFDSKTKPSGDALKNGIEGVFKRVLGYATKVVPMVKHFLLDMIIYGLKAYIALKPIAKTIQDFFASAEGSAALNFVFTSLLSVFKAVGVGIIVIVAFFASMIAIAAVVSTTVWTLIGAFLGLASTIGGAVADVISLVINKLGEWASSANEAAVNFIDGLVQGIANGATAVADAVKNVASGAVKSFKSVLGIASPSKVAMDISGNVTDTMATGLDAGVSTVKESSDAVASAAIPKIPDMKAPLVAPITQLPETKASIPLPPSNMPANQKSDVEKAPAIAASNDAANDKGGGNSGTVIHVDVGGINLGGANGGAPKGAEELTEEAVTLIFERVALRSGL